MVLIQNIKNKWGLNNPFILNAFLSLNLLLLCRLIANYFIPLNDTTEARYSEIARKMLETGNWVTPQHDYGVPFWAKPPLSSWLSALSMKCFGVNEFAARLPSLLLSLAVLSLVWFLAKKRMGIMAAWVCVLVLFGSFYFFLDAGAVMTEPALLFCTTLSLLAFWRALADESTLWSYLFFIGLGLGLLAKGPIALVLVGLPVFFWVLTRQEWRNLWSKLPWIKGSLLLSIIALPWYVIAELRTPGFLNYFIMGEHVHRFLTPGWAGDKYGMAHYAPKGMIWFYAIIGILPWTPVVFGWLFKQSRNLFLLCRDDEGWVSYLVMCTFIPLVFFTFAGNIIYPYVFPSLPAFALLFAHMWQQTANPSSMTRLWIPRCALIPGLCALLVTFMFIAHPDLVGKTQKMVVTAWKRHHPAPHSQLIYWARNTDFSAQFYSAGAAKSAMDSAQLHQLMQNHLENYLVINAQDVGQIQKDILNQCALADTLFLRDNKLFLFRCPAV